MSILPDDYGTVRVIEGRYTACFNCEGRGYHQNPDWVAPPSGVTVCCVCHGIGLVLASFFGNRDDDLDKAAQNYVERESSLDPDEDLVPCPACFESSGFNGRWVSHTWYEPGYWDTDYSDPCPVCNGTGSEVVTMPEFTIDDLDQRCGAAE